MPTTKKPNSLKQAGTQLNLQDELVSQVDQVYTTIVDKKELYKNSLFILGVWVRRYVGEGVTISDLKEKVLFETTSIAQIASVDTMLDQIALDGFPSRQNWIFDTFKESKKK